MLPRWVYALARVLAVLLIFGGTGVFYFGYVWGGRTIFLQQVSAEDVTRGFDFGPIYMVSGLNYLARLELVIPESGEFWETTLAVLDSNKAVVGKESVFLAVTQKEFAPGERTVLPNHFRLMGDSGWYYFRFQQVAGSYPALGAMGPPAAKLELREGLMNATAAWAALALGWIAGIALFLRPR